MNLEQSKQEIKRNINLWAKRLIPWTITLIIGVSVFFNLDTLGKIICSLFLIYNIFVISVPIRALLECWFWWRDIEKSSEK